MITKDHATAGRLRVAVIVGSTREGRRGEAIARWFVDQARRRDDLELDVLDLVGFDFPAAHPAAYPHEVTAFTGRIERADAFVIVTPEYNHSYPASVKQAIDYGRAEWKAKPVSFISYGGMAQGTRAVEHLRTVFAELHAATTRDGLSFNLWEATFDEGGFHPADEQGAARAATVMLDQLSWWGHALRDARTVHPYAA